MSKCYFCTVYWLITPVNSGQCLMRESCNHGCGGMSQSSVCSSPPRLSPPSPCFLFVLQLCGCGLLGVGIWLSVSQGSFATFSPSLPALSAANMVIGIGAIVMVTGFLGCLGAIKENKCLLLSVS